MPKSQKQIKKSYKKTYKKIKKSYHNTTDINYLVCVQTLEEAKKKI